MTSGRAVPIQPHWDLSALQVVSRGRGRGYTIVTADGEPASGAYPDKVSAEMRIERIRHAARRIERPCMCCGQRFPSDGPHNRMCSSCRYESEEISPQWAGW